MKPVGPVTSPRRPRQKARRSASAPAGSGRIAVSSLGSTLSTRHGPRLGLVGERISAQHVVRALLRARDGERRRTNQALLQVFQKTRRRAGNLVTESSARALSGGATCRHAGTAAEPRVPLVAAGVG